MPLYTQMGLELPRPLTMADYRPTFGEYIGAVWDDTANDSLYGIISNLNEANEKRYGFDVFEIAEEGGLVAGLEEIRSARTPSRMSLEDQQAYIRSCGLEGMLLPDERYTREELEFLANLKHEEIERQFIREQAPAWIAPFGFATGLGASMLDYVNIAASFVPVVGEARTINMLRHSAGNAWGRAGVRFGVGAVEGLVGTAIVEPVFVVGKSELQQEYDFADSLMNIAFGAGMGAMLHPLGGAVGEWKRARAGQRQPWEYIASTDTTERLRLENVQRIWGGMQESGSELLSPEHAEAAAALWDATIRGYAYDTGESVENLYRQFHTEYRGGELSILSNGDGRRLRPEQVMTEPGKESGPSPTDTTDSVLSQPHTLHQEARNSFGVATSRVTRIEGTITREELDAALSALAGQDLPNFIEGMTAQVNGRQRGKLAASSAAHDKSLEIDLSRGEHQGIAAQIANAWKWAAEAVRSGDTKSTMPDVGIRRYVSALDLNGKDVFAWFTVKETPTGPRIYSVELMDEKKLRSTLANGTDRAAATAPIRSLEEIAARLNKTANNEQALLQKTPVTGSNAVHGEQKNATAAKAPVVVRGDELGVPEGAELKEYMAAARKFHDALKYESEHGKPVMQPQLDRPVRFSRKGWSKNAHAGASPDKWKMFSRLREIIEQSTLVQSSGLTKPRKDGFTRFHWVESNVELDGVERRVGLMLAEDPKGNLFYNLNADVAAWEKRNDSSKLPANSRAGESESFQQSAVAPVKNTLPVSEDGVNLYILSEGERPEAPRARVMFGVEDAYALVEFFRSADPSSAPHEMYHIFRRIMAELYENPNASEASRQRYRKACDFVGAEPGRPWTPEQEEKFARAGERFLLEGIVPNPHMGDVMESFRQWMSELYGSAERSGLEISDGMREVFGGMLGTAEDGDMNFRYTMGRILDYSPEADSGTSAGRSGETSAELAPGKSRNVVQRQDEGSAAGGGAPGHEDALWQAVQYEQTPMGDAARASFRRDIHDFGVAVDKIAAARKRLADAKEEELTGEEKKLLSSPVRMLGQTPLVMQLLGRDTVTGKAAAKGGIYAAPHVFDDTHPNMTSTMRKQIPAAMADPIAIFDSASPAGRANGDLVFMLELTDANGATVVVPVALDSRGKLGVQVNIAKSAYAKEDEGIPLDDWFLKQAKKNARYINRQKWKRWSIGSGATSPLVASNASGKKIYTEVDLVKWRRGNPALYQSARHGSAQLPDDGFTFGIPAPGAIPDAAFQNGTPGIKGERPEAPRSRVMFGAGDVPAESSGKPGSSFAPEFSKATSPVRQSETYMADATARVNQALKALADRPETQEAFRKMYEADMAAADALVMEARQMGKIRQAAGRMRG